MGKNLLHHILRRIDQIAPPVKLDAEEVDTYPREELEALRCDKILKPYGRLKARLSEFFSPTRAATIPREGGYEVDIPRIAELLRERNRLEGEFSSSGMVLFALGERKIENKRSSRVHSIKVFFSLFNRDESRFMDVCERIRDPEHSPIFLLTPQPVIISSKKSREIRTWGLNIISLIEHLTCDNWILPWDKLIMPFSDVKEPVLKITRKSHQVYYKGIEIKITPTPFRFLLTLAENAGKPVNRSELVQKASKVAAREDINEVNWAKEHKLKIMKKFRALVGKNYITKEEVENLITSHDGCYRLNLSYSDILIE